MLGRAKKRQIEKTLGVCLSFFPKMIQFVSFEAIADTQKHNSMMLRTPGKRKVEKTLGVFLSLFPNMIHIVTFEAITKTQ